MVDVVRPLTGLLMALAVVPLAWSCGAPGSCDSLYAHSGRAETVWYCRQSVTDGDDTDRDPPADVAELLESLGYNLTWHAQDDLLTLTYDGVEGGTYQVTFRADAPECFE